MKTNGVLSILLPILSAIISSYVTRYFVTRARKKIEEKPYDIFISYSSRDEKEVIAIQNDLESYRPPRNLVEEGNMSSIRVFRDKSDQGVTIDFRESFKAKIRSLHSFLLIGSSNSFKSNEVKAEVSNYLSTGKSSINLGWLDSALTAAFSEEVLQKFPRALYADLRMLKTRRNWRWYFGTRTIYKYELMRLVASILSARLNREITFETLLQREKQRKQKKRLVILTAFLVGLTLIAGYYWQTPEYAWHYTVIGKTQITDWGSVFIDEKMHVRIRDVVERGLIDDGSGEMKSDNHLAIYQINEDGDIEGEIDYRESIEGISEIDFYGCFEQMNTDEIDSLIRDGYSHIAKDADAIDKYVAQSLDDVITHGLIKAGWDSENGKVYFVAVIDSDNIWDSMSSVSGGIFKSEDGGKSWENVSSHLWKSFSSVVADIKNQKKFAVVTTENQFVAPTSSSVQIPSPWITHDNGLTWSMIGPEEEKIDAKEIELMGLSPSGNIIASMNGIPVVYKKRALLDRLLQRFDDI